MAFQSKIQCWAQILLLMVDTSCKERTLVPFFKVTKHIDRLAPSHQAVLFDGPLSPRLLAMWQHLLQKEWSELSLPILPGGSCPMFEEGSPNGQFLGPFNPTSLSRPVLAPGKWAAWAACEAGRREMGVDGQQFNIFLQMAVFMPTRNGAW